MPSNGSTAAAAAGIDGGAVGGSAPAALRRFDPVQLLTFDSLSCTVPTRQGWSWGRLFPGRGAAGDKAGDGGKAGNAAAAPGAAAAADAAGAPGVKHILRGVTGVAACGELVGVLGPSGSGKTTLLAMIAGSTEDLDASSALTGSVRMDGAELRSSSQRRKVRGGQCSLCCPCPRRCLHFLC